MFATYNLCKSSTRATGKQTHRKYEMEQRRKKTQSQTKHKNRPSRKRNRPWEGRDLRLVLIRPEVVSVAECEERTKWRQDYTQRPLECSGKHEGGAARDRAWGVPLIAELMTGPWEALECWRREPTAVVCVHIAPAWSGTNCPQSFDERPCQAAYWVRGTSDSTPSMMKTFLPRIRSQDRPAPRAVPPEVLACAARVKIRCWCQTAYSWRSGGRSGRFREFWGFPASFLLFVRASVKLVSCFSADPRRV